MKAGAALFAFWLLCAPTLALADARVDFLKKRLEKASDARGRAQAALMLGATGELGALGPLCKALQDKEPLVRTSAAKGLQELGSADAVRCLEARQAEPDPEVKAAIAGALQALQEPARARPVLYVLLDPLKDARDKADPASAKLLEERLRTQLISIGVVFAPPSETAGQARAVMKSKKLKGYYLMPKLQSLPSGGLKLVLVGFTYPEKSLLGEVTMKASGAPAPDLIRAIVPAAVKNAAENFEWGVTP
jgi:HEAT repeat protein